MDTHTIRRFVRTHKLMVVYGTILCVAVLGIFLGIIPVMKQVMNLIEETNTLTTDVGKMNGKVALLASYDTAFLENAYTNVQAALPQDKSIDTFLTTVESVAAKQGLVIDSFTLDKIGAVGSGSAQPAPKTPGAQSVRATVSVLGDLSNIRNFLQQIIKVRRLVRVDDINVSFLKTRQTMSADIVMEGFYQPLPTVLGKTSDTIDPLSEKQLSTLQTISSYPIAFQQTGGTQGAAEPQTPAVANPFSPNPE